MNWFNDVADYILNNMDSYTDTFLKAPLQRRGRSWFINPCPFCGHNDSFSLTAGVNAFHCFSGGCNESGTLIQLVEKLNGVESGRRMLEEWSGISNPYNNYSPEQASIKQKKQRLQHLYDIGIAFYQSKLMTAVEEVDGEKRGAGRYQTEVRKHEYETLRKFRVGYSVKWPAVVEKLKKEGFTDEEIEESSNKLRFPEGYFLYPYYDQHGNLLRINGKFFIRKCWGSRKEPSGFAFDCNYKSFDRSKENRKRHENSHKHTMAPEYLSKGDKTDAFFFFPRDVRPSGKVKKKAILVEGEDDIQSLDEALQKIPKFSKIFVPICVGGKPLEGLFKSKFLRQFEEVYEAFDNDEAGDSYREQLDREMPEVPLKRIVIPDEYGDIDEFLKHTDDAIEQLEEMIDNAVTVAPKHYLLERTGKRSLHKWEIRNRHFGISYSIDKYNRNKHKFDGVLQFYRNGIKTHRKNGDIDALNPPAPQDNFIRLKSILSDAIHDYYHDDLRMDQGKPQRPYRELLDVFKFTRHQTEVTRQLAWYIYEEEKEGNESNKEKLVSEAKKILRSDVDVETILKEVNGYQNQAIDVYASFPRIHLSQSMFPINDDAYMYFSKVVRDGEDTKRVPCLLSNKKNVIRLDILRKKELQSLILIENKYELKEEVEVAFIDESILSLQQGWVEKWKNGEIPQEKLLPENIIGEIENFIRLTYYAPEEVIKVICLWIYATYFYQLFRSGFPYLMINGGKGTGKTTLDKILKLLSFNPMFTVSTSEAALYRHLTLIGGTFILDEMENLADAKRNEESPIATVLKSGYSDGGEILRTDKETGFPKNFTAFGPKVISNINGLEDVLEDRCIPIYTVAVPENKVKQLKEITPFFDEKRHLIYDISSRAAISALIHFKEVNKIFNTDTRLQTGNLRLTQILRPIITMARFVGGDYEENFLKFYESTIQMSKQDTKLGTLEGKIEQILLWISEEVLDLANERHVIGTRHVYDKGLSFDKETSTFEIDSLMVKVLVQEMDTDNVYPLAEINRKMKTVLGKDFDIANNRTKTKTTVEDEGLLRQLNNQKYPQVYRYTLNARTFIPPHVEKAKYRTRENAEVLF